MSKPLPEELLSAYLDGELSPEEAEIVRTQLAGEGDTEQQQALFLQGMRENQSRLRRLPSFQLDADFANRVMAKIEFADSGHPQVQPGSESTAAGTRSTESKSVVPSSSIPAFSPNQPWRISLAAIVSLAAMVLLTLFLRPPIVSDREVADFDPDASGVATAGELEGKLPEQLNPEESESAMRDRDRNSALDEKTGNENDDQAGTVILGKDGQPIGKSNGGLQSRQGGGEFKQEQQPRRDNAGKIVEGKAEKSIDGKSLIEKNKGVDPADDVKFDKKVDPKKVKQSAKSGPAKPGQQDKPGQGNIAKHAEQPNYRAPEQGFKSDSVSPKGGGGGGNRGGLGGGGELSQNVPPFVNDQPEANWGNYNGLDGIVQVKVTTDDFNNNRVEETLLRNQIAVDVPKNQQQQQRAGNGQPVQVEEQLKQMPQSQTRFIYIEAPTDRINSTLKQLKKENAEIHPHVLDNDVKKAQMQLIQRNQMVQSQNLRNSKSGDPNPKGDAENLPVDMKQLDQMQLSQTGIAKNYVNPTELPVEERNRFYRNENQSSQQKLKMRDENEIADPDAGERKNSDQNVRDRRRQKTLDPLSDLEQDEDLKGKSNKNAKNAKDLADKQKSNEEITPPQSGNKLNLKRKDDTRSDKQKADPDKKVAGGKKSDGPKDGNQKPPLPKLGKYQDQNEGGKAWDKNKNKDDDKAADKTVEKGFDKDSKNAGEQGGQKEKSKQEVTDSESKKAFNKKRAEDIQDDPTKTTDLAKSKDDKKSRPVPPRASQADGGAGKGATGKFGRDSGKGGRGGGQFGDKDFVDQDKRMRGQSSREIGDQEFREIQSYLGLDGRQDSVRRVLLVIQSSPEMDSLQSQRALKPAESKDSKVLKQPKAKK